MTVSAGYNISACFFSVLEKIHVHKPHALHYMVCVCVSVCVCVCVCVCCMSLCDWCINILLGLDSMPSLFPPCSLQLGCCCCCCRCCCCPCLHAYSCFWPLIAFVENTVVAADIRKKKRKKNGERGVENNSGCSVHHHREKTRSWLSVVHKTRQMWVNNPSLDNIYFLFFIF